MYAVIETGGKQYRVELGTVLEVERLDVEQGQAVTLDRVLLVADETETAIGRPVVPNATVEAEVVRQARGEKIDVFKYRPKARRRVKKGHRQELTVLRIADIRFNGRSAAELASQAQEAAKTERQRLEEAAARQAAADRELAARLAAKWGIAAPGQPSAGEPKTRERNAAAPTEAGATRARGRSKALPAPEATAPEATAPEATAPEATAPPSETGPGDDRPRPARRTRPTKKDA